MKLTYLTLSIATLCLFTGCAQNPTTTSAVSWDFNGSSWQSTGNTPSCPDPITIELPYQDATPTSLLYPGQTRGGNYKSHGGFRFDRNPDGAVTVVAPLDAKVVEGSRYIEAGEVQHYFIFINDCGLMYRLDHLYTLSPAFQAIADQLPAAQPDDSRTTKLTAPVAVQAGDVVATKVGFPSIQNISFDFGLYDLRTDNGNDDHNDPQFAPYGICFLEYLPKDNIATLTALPTDTVEGKINDYCPGI